ncbi:MAG: GNAT family N-acetyltransferase [Chloroflexota bacterium]|nr:GNAT family N-acetyltransferase [Chloroflexota bacterium]
MCQQVTIRIAVRADIEAVQHVASETWRATYAGAIPDVDINLFLDSAYSDRSLAAAVNRLGDGFVVAERQDNVIGYAMAGPNRDGEPELYAIYVLPEQHGTGAGQILWDAARSVLSRQGQTRMCCWVLASNVRARRFYERQGAILAEAREFAVGATMIREARYCVMLSE